MDVLQDSQYLRRICERVVSSLIPPNMGCGDGLVQPLVLYFHRMFERVCSIVLLQDVWQGIQKFLVFLKNYQRAASSIVCQKDQDQGIMCRSCCRNSEQKIVQENYLAQTEKKWAYLINVNYYFLLTLLNSFHFH